MILKTLDDFDVKSKNVLVRVDFNVPIIDGHVTDTTRIERHAKTILELQEKGAKIILLSHLGRPKKQKNPEFSLKKIVKTVEKTIKHPIHFVDETLGTEVENAISNMQDGDIVLLENVRFYAGEEENDPDFIEKLSQLGDLYIQDAFSVAHRAHASTAGLADKLPTLAGRAMQAEINALNKGLETPHHPVIALVGGAKVSTKIDLLANLVQKVDALIIGGAMANSFLFAQGFSIGQSLHEPDLVNTALEILARAREANCAIILPIDAIVAWHFKEDSPHQTYGIDAIPADGMILDIGEQSRQKIEAAIHEAKTLLWNGPLGAFELHPFDAGTVYTAQIAAERTREGQLISIAGGGDTVSALNHAKVAEDFTYISTAGGAFLEWLEGKTLPGVQILYKS